MVEVSTLFGILEDFADVSEAGSQGLSKCFSEREIQNLLVALLPYEFFDCFGLTGT
jgi:hypothetical protein